jgi:hypothetical protein
MLKISDKELAQIGRKDAITRYEYFIKKVADQQEICILRDSGGDYYLDVVDNEKFIHMWCSTEYATNFIKNKEVNHKPVTIDFDFLRYKLCPMIKEKEITLSIMPSKEHTGYCIHLDKFIHDLKHYLDEWYS